MSKWEKTTVKDFLGLTDKENDLVEKRVATTIAHMKDKPDHVVASEIKRE